MSAPKKTRRDYRDAAGKRLPSVTTILGKLAKPELMGWYAKVAADAAARGVRDGLSVAEATALGIGAPNATRDAKADAGTLAHAYVEAFYGDEPVLADLDDEKQAAAHAIYRRVVDHVTTSGLTVLRSEVALVDLGSGYGGTFDLVVERDGQRYIADLKTGKGVYPEVVAQLAAYRALYLLNFPGEAIHGGLVIHAPSDGPVVEHTITSAALDAGSVVFCALLHIYKTLPAMKIEAPNG